MKTAETIWQARQKAPHLITLPPHHGLYREYSQKVNAIYGQYTDLVEPFGIDESWLDITGSMHLFGGDGKAIADQLRQRLREELGLTISVGVSFNKIFAKLGSDYKKPDATTVIDRDNWQRIVWPLPVGDLLGVGRSTQKLLRQYGVETIGQLAAFPRETLETLMGKHGAQLHDYANGQENSPVRPQHEAEPVKSVGNGTTFPANLTRWEQVRAGLSALADSVAGRHVLRRRGADHPVRGLPPVHPPDPAERPHPSAKGYLSGGADAGSAGVARTGAHPRPDGDGAVPDAGR